MPHHGVSGEKIRLNQYSSQDKLQSGYNSHNQSPIPPDQYYQGH